MAKKISRKMFMKQILKMVDGEVHLVKYGILLERKRVELGSVEELINWLIANDLPFYLVSRFFKV